MTGIISRCPDDGHEHALGIYACSVCFGELRFWCTNCLLWVTDEMCAGCRTRFANPAAQHSDLFNSRIVARVRELKEEVAPFLRLHNPRQIIGPILSKYLNRGKGTTLVTLAVTSDCLRVAVEAVGCDGEVTTEEVQRLKSFIETAAAFFGRHRGTYSHFAGAGNTVEAACDFIRLFVRDSKPFGYSNQATRWSGLHICNRIATQFCSTRPRDLYLQLVVDVADELIRLQGTQPKELHYLTQLKLRLKIK